ncbi:MAG: hypothetical protein LC679_04440 [Intrasporangiaceae bacterium]|nr:hypothetical protein [Intrasporangiaceae bacterium]
MTTAHHPSSTTQGSHRGLSALGTMLVALPLIGGVLAALVALTGRLGEPENALTAAWYVPMAIGWFALVGAAVLLILHRNERLMTQRLATWSAVAAGGWVFAIGSAQVTGLAEAASMNGMGWQIALLAFGVAVYIIGLLGLTATGVKASTPEDDYY